MGVENYKGGRAEPPAIAPTPSLDPLADAAISPRAKLRLKCLELACTGMYRMGLSEPTIVADKFIAWVLEQENDSEASGKAA